MRMPRILSVLDLRKCVGASLNSIILSATIYSTYNCINRDLWSSLHIENIHINLAVSLSAFSTQILCPFEFLSGAVGHHGDNLVEKILTVLKPLSGHVTDIQVDMLELTSLQRTPHSHTILAPGCLAQNQ